jgi:hypothetical protein
VTANCKWVWIAFIMLVLMFQALLLGTFAQHIASYLPTAFDQAVYLTDSYQIYESMRLNGLLPGLIRALLRPAPQGVLVDPVAALAYVAFGAGRLTALSLNILAFLTYLATTAYFIGRAIGPLTATLALALILSARSPFIIPGGYADFRYDHIAMCLWGIILTVAVFTPRNMRAWVSVGTVAVAGILLVLCRLVTATYLIPLLLLIIWIKWLTLNRYGDNAYQLFGATCRMSAALLPVLVVLATTVVIVAMNFPYLVSYYVRGHLTSSEKEVRAAQVGVTDLISNITYYPKSVLATHLGLGALALMTLVVVGVVALIFSRSSSIRLLSQQWPRLAVIVAALAIPFVVLTADLSKSPVVGSVFIPAVVLAVVSFAAIVELSMLSLPVAAVRVFSILVLVTLGWATVVELQNRLSAEIPEPLADSYREAERLDLTAGDYVQRSLNAKGVWSTDGHVDLMGVQTAQAYNYESAGRMLNLSGTSLGSGSVDEILAADDILNVAKQSDVLVLTQPDASAPASPYPVDNAIAANSAQLWDFANGNLIPLGSYSVYGRSVTLFVRPVVSVHGTSGSWITSAGIDLVLPKVQWNSPGCATLQGASNLSWLPSSPGTIATHITAGANEALKSGFIPNGNAYRIWIDVPADVFAANGTIHVDFSTYFVPSQIGVSQDGRQLVIVEPSTSALVSGQCSP